jgi:methylase of polypeptide subunit release factors
MSNCLNEVLNADIVISNPPYLSEQHYSKYLKPQIKLF